MKIRAGEKEVKTVALGNLRTGAVFRLDGVYYMKVAVIGFKVADDYDQVVELSSGELSEHPAIKKVEEDPDAFVTVTV